MNSIYKSALTAVILALAGCSDSDIPNIDYNGNVSKSITMTNCSWTALSLGCEVHNLTDNNYRSGSFAFTAFDADNNIVFTDALDFELKARESVEKWFTRFKTRKDVTRITVARIKRK